MRNRFPSKQSGKEGQAKHLQILCEEKNASEEQGVEAENARNGAAACFASAAIFATLAAYFVVKEYFTYTDQTHNFNSALFLTVGSTFLGLLLLRLEA